ncbi:hypothetical protein HK102_013505, partial [Quaeritorhiza haematococci]
AKDKINTYFTQHNLDWTAAIIFVALCTAYILPANKTRARRQVWHLEQHNCKSTKRHLIRFQDVAAAQNSPTMLINMLHSLVTSISLSETMMPIKITPKPSTTAQKYLGQADKPRKGG